MATVGSLATLVGGRVVGDADLRIRDVADLESAGPEHLSFLANTRYRDEFDRTRAGAVLVPEGITHDSTTLIVCANPYLALARVATELHPPSDWPAGIEAGAHVHPGARIDPTATVRVGAVVEVGAAVGARSVIGAGCYVGREARLGDDVVMHPGSRLLERCVLGNRVLLQPGAVVGSDGFGYAPDAQLRRHKIPQVGIVEIGDDVEIGANATVDRATFGATRIGPGTKIDNLVQIGHNVATGRDCVIVAQSGIAGSTAMGDRVIMGAQTGVAGHLEISSDVTLAARGAIGGNLRDAGVYSGVPAMPHKLWLKVAMAQRQLPEIRRRLRQLERELEALQAVKE
jgi:UDP-3-O-[3-hydroxymyristoyl] glucosamine N-acyltransferase